MYTCLNLPNRLVSGNLLQYVASTATNTKSTTIIYATGVVTAFNSIYFLETAVPSKSFTNITTVASSPIDLIAVTVDVRSLKVTLS